MGRDAGVEKGKPMGKSSIQKVGKTKLTSRMKNLLMFLPNMVVLSAKLMVDSRVPRTERALFAAALIYAIIPFDFIPDMIPFVGQIDDVFLISLTVLRLIDHTDDLVVREHWRGDQRRFFLFFQFQAMLVVLFSLPFLAVANNSVSDMTAWWLAGIAIWLAVQSIINMGVNVGLLPTKGLTLPFLSFGGSGVVANCCALALLLRIDWESRQLMRGKVF